LKKLKIKSKSEISLIKKCVEKRKKVEDNPKNKKRIIHNQSKKNIQTKQNQIIG
jgi:hypothetical protein